MDSKPDIILFYDGDCAFCNKTVQFILKNEKVQSIYFASLQSQFTLEFLKEKSLPQPDMSTLLLYKEGEIYERSKAALIITQYLKFPYNWLRIFRIIPKNILDSGYNFIAQHRRKFAKEFCLIPNTERKGRFLN